VSDRSVNNGQGISESDAGGPARDWQLQIVRQLQAHWWRFI
jgi:hypothetical protein